MGSIIMAKLNMMDGEPAAAVLFMIVAFVSLIFVIIEENIQ